MIDTVNIPLIFIIAVPVWVFCLGFILYWLYVRKRIHIKILAPYYEEKTKTKTKGVWRVVKKARVGLSEQTFEHDKNVYNIDLRKSFLDSKDNPNLFFKLGNVEPLGIEQIGNMKSAGMLKNILDTNAYGKLLQGYRDKTYITIIVVLIVCMGLVIGFSVYNMNVMNNRIVQLTEYVVNVTSIPDWIVR